MEKRMNVVKKKLADQKFSWLYNISKKNDDSLFFILGPCVIESERHCLLMAEYLTKISEKLKIRFIFKASFDKANRTSISSFRGVGVAKGLKILEKVRSTFSIPVITDIHESYQINEVASVVDVLQIPAFLCRQTDLLLAAGKTGKIVNLKKGQFVAPESFYNVYEKLRVVGNNNVWLCERGYSFGYSDLIVDYRNFVKMKRFGVPVIFDVTHSVQRPGAQETSSGGDREFVPFLAASAIVQGISGLFMEVHDRPEKALSDGPNSIALKDLRTLLMYFIRLDEWSKKYKIPAAENNENFVKGEKYEI
jgi:2-dehydro-3-deoxyphosphooctonate aldolase (KDO 8-P synthase)